MRKIISMLLVTTLSVSLLTSTFAADASKFTDVTTADWYYGNVTKMVSEGYMLGTSETAFEPAKNITRAMFVTVLSRIANIKQENNDTVKFNDVLTGQWYSQAIAWASSKELVNGYGNGNFGTNDSITRQDAVVLIARFIDFMGYSLDESKETVLFTDADIIAPYAKDAINLSVQSGIVTGYQDGSFQPKRMITRAEAAAIFSRLTLVIAGEEPQPDPKPDDTGTGGSTGGGGGGGGGGGATTVTTTKKLVVSALIKTENSAQSLNLQSKPYTLIYQNGAYHSGDGAVNASMFTADLLGGDNVLAITNAFGIELDKLKNHKYSQDVNGKNITVEIAVNDIISAQADTTITNFVSVSALANAANVPNEDVQATLSALESGSGNVNQDVIDALTQFAEALEKGTSFAGITWDDAAIEQALDKAVENASDIEKSMLESVTVSTVKNSVREYANALPTFTTGNSVVLSVTLDLTEMLKSSRATYEKNMSDILKEVQNAIPTVDVAAWNAFVNALSPTDFLASDDTSVRLKTPAMYQTLLSNISQKTFAFTNTLVGNQMDTVLEILTNELIKQGVNSTSVTQITDFLKEYARISKLELKDIPEGSAPFATLRVDFNAFISAMPNFSLPTTTNRVQIIEMYLTSPKT